MSNQDFQTFKIYTRVADELQNTSPIVAYYLKTYTLNKAVEYLKIERSKGQDVSSRTQEIKEWLSDLEKLKTIVNQDLLDREKCKLSYQTFTLTLFHESDGKFKRGELSRKLAKDFLYISVLFDAWELVGVQSEQIKEKKTYSNDARFKIMDAINKSNKPESLPKNNETEKKGAAPKQAEKETRDRKKTLDPLAKLNFDFTESIFIPQTTFDKILEGIKPDVKIGFINTQNNAENNPNQINTNEPPKNRFGIPMGRSVKLADNPNNEHQNQNQHQQPLPQFGGYQHPPPYFPNNSNESNNSNPQQMYYQYPPPNQFNNGYYDMPPPQQQQQQQPFFNGSEPQNSFNNNNNNNNQGYLFPPVDYQNQTSVFYAPPRCLNSQNNLASLSQQQYQNAPYYDSRLAYGPGASGALQNYPQNSTQFQPSQPYNPYQQPPEPYPQQQQYPSQPFSRGAESQNKTANPYQPQDLQNSGNPYHVAQVGPESSGSSHPSNPYLPQQNSGTQALGASNHKQSSELLKDFSVDTPSQDSLKKSSNIFAQNEHETSHQDTTSDTPTDPNPLTTSQKLTSTPNKANVVETPQGTPEGDRVRPDITTPRETTPELTPEPFKQETEKKARIGKVISSAEAKNYCLLAASELDFNKLKEAKEKMYEALKIIEQLEMIQNQ